MIITQVREPRTQKTDHSKTNSNATEKNRNIFVFLLLSVTANIVKEHFFFLHDHVFSIVL